MLKKYFEHIDVICVVRRDQSSHTGIWHYRRKRVNAVTVATMVVLFQNLIRNLC